jgi:hypothetical protein
MKAKHWRSPCSPERYWMEHREEMLKDFPVVNEKEMAKKLFSKLNIVMNFRPADMTAVVEQLVKDSLIKPSGLRVLDPCAGWGDRLISSMTNPRIYEYTGVDPNIFVHEGYKKIIEKINTVVPDLVKKVNLHVQRFEVFDAPSNYYDLIFTSPPYFDTEDYVTEEMDPLNKCRKNQSHVMYKTLEEWLEGFVRPFIKNCRKTLIVGGILALNINDIPDFSRQYVERIFQIVDTVGQFDYVGTITIARNFDTEISPQPIFFWKKRQEKGVDTLSWR